MGYYTSYKRRYPRTERPAPKPSFWSQFQIVTDEGASCPIDLRSPSADRKQLGSGEYNAREGTALVYAIESRGQVFVREATMSGWQWSPAVRVQS